MTARARTPFLLLLLGLAALGLPPAARAYDARTTHLGLTERAAQAARLHTILVRRLGRPLGLLEPLRLTPSPDLLQRLGRLDPAEGLVPDEHGENTALGWLLAGAALEDVPPARMRNHFFDPGTGRGLHESGALTRMFFFFFGDREVGGSFDLTGRAAPDFAVAPDNELGLGTLLDALERSATETEPPARSAQTARALLAMGALCHLLQDLGSPSHVRNDFRGAHLERVPGSSVWDQRSLYERFVAQRYGRLGVPAALPGPLPEHARLRDHFTALAAWVAPRFFSRGTLPREFEVPPGAAPAELLARANQSLVRAAPRMDRIAAPFGAVGTAGSTEVPLLAVFSVESGVVRFDLDASVHAAYARALLPRVAQASAGLLAFLLRGQLAITRDGDALVLQNRGPALASGTLRLFAEDEKGRRQPMALPFAPAWPVAAGAELGRIPVTGSGAPSEGTRRLIAVFRGQDAAGEPLVAIEDVSAQAPPVANKL